MIKNNTRNLNSYWIVNTMRKQKVSIHCIVTW